MGRNDEALEFVSFGKILREKHNNIVVTEKIDGTNAQIFVAEDGRVRAGSRNRWISVESDNFGFAAWVEENQDELRRLGPGRHYGEWWGRGIQRGYCMDSRAFSIFNSFIPPETLPECVRQVPVLYTGRWSDKAIDGAFDLLGIDGSVAAPGFMSPEGIIIYCHLGKRRLKRTFDGNIPKYKLQSNF